jgi:hypothetical protein
MKMGTEQQQCQKCYETELKNAEVSESAVNALVMQFEVGKYYRHNGGGVMHIVGAAKTTLYGWCLIAEEHSSSNLKPIGVGPGFSDNWQETTKEDWLSGFSA